MNVTEFYFEIPGLLKQVHNDVLRAARNRAGLNLDEVVSNDDEDSLITFLRTIANDVFAKHTSPLARTLADLETPLTAFEYDVTFNDGASDHANSIVYRVIFPEKFDVTTIPAVEKTIEDTLVSYCVWKWLEDINLEGWQIYQVKHLNKRDDLISAINRRVRLRRTPKLY